MVTCIAFIPCPQWTAARAKRALRHQSIPPLIAEEPPDEDHFETNGIRAVIGGSWNDWYKQEVGGVAWLNTFGNGTTSKPNNASNVSEATSRRASKKRQSGHRHASGWIVVQVACASIHICTMRAWTHACKQSGSGRPQYVHVCSGPILIWRPTIYPTELAAVPHPQTLSHRPFRACVESCLIDEA